ncbi:MAG: hypothetical protein K2I48_10425, partial [Muribaculaceae bacterium]|nr:hypothetical protein [Muribaculaceae bacterium]
VITMDHAATLFPHRGARNVMRPIAFDNANVEINSAKVSKSATFHFPKPANLPPALQYCSLRDCSLHGGNDTGIGKFSIFFEKRQAASRLRRCGLVKI